MKAIILVGGEGLRLRPLTCNIPKPMVPIVNKPFLEHMVDNLKRHNISEIILAICYLPEMIQDHFGNGSNFGIKMMYTFEHTPLGTGGAIKNAEPFIDDTFVVCNGDIFTDIDLTDMIQSHRLHKAQATIALTPIEDPTAYGVVEIDGECMVKAFIEKPLLENVTSNLINAGTYIFEPEILEYIPADIHNMVERGLFPEMVELGLPFFGYPSAAYWIDIGKSADYLKLHHDILMGKAKARFPGKSVADDVWLCEGCDVYSSAKIIGPVIIGNNCKIGPEVHISGPTVLGDSCTIGRGVTIDESVIWGNATLGNNTVLRNSIIGKNSFIGNNSWIVEGTVIGDNARIGDGNRLEHGIKIWPNAIIKDHMVSF